MATVQFTWSFEAPNNIAEPSRTTQEIPSCGSSETKVPSGESTLAALAQALDTARSQLNGIVTHWKDLVGSEQDSSHGIGNKHYPSANREAGKDNVDDVDEDDEADDDE